MAVYLVFVFVIGVFYFLYSLLFSNRNYWRSRNVPFVQPLPLFGSFKDCFFMKKHRSEILQEICQQYPNEPYIGCFYGTTPALVIQDPNLLKLVMLKEFYYFSGRETSDHIHKDLFMNNLILAHGDEWKVLRTNLTPLFSSMKLKNMFYMIKNSSDMLESLLAEEIKTNENCDIGNLFSKYTMDCLMACVFGMCSETMKNDIHKNPFTTMGEKMFDTSEYAAVKNIFQSMWPRLFYALGFTLLDDDFGNFFNKLIHGVFKNREETKTSKNDFVDLILTWKRDNCITADSLSNAKTGDKKKVSIEVSEELLISQCVLFFGAGYETTALSMSYLLYELAKNKIVQEKVIKEVDEYFTKHDTIEYECIDMLKFTEACLEESLRLHPVFLFFTRQVTHGYSLPTGLHMKKGDRIFIPVREIQRNPDNFPEPELFRPERFLGEEKKNIKPYTYMPFGEGPRMCIGKRFAKMPMYAALLKVFKNYTVELAENMPRKLTSNPKSITFNQPTGGIHVKFVPRNG